MNRSFFAVYKKRPLPFGNGRFLCMDQAFKPLYSMILIVVR